MVSAGGGTLVFDPDAAQAAANAVRGILQDAGNVRARCVSQHQRASDMWSSFLNRLEGLTELAVEALWYEVGLGGLSGELQETARWLDDLRARLEGVRTGLVETHPGPMERELYDRLTPHIAAFQSHREQIIRAANAVFFAGVAGPVGLCIELLEIVCAGLDVESAGCEDLNGWLEWVAAREIDLINFAKGHPDSVWKAFALGQDGKSAWDLLKALRNEKGLLTGLEDLTKATPGGAALDILWTFLATGDISAHGVGAAIYGEAFQIGVYAIPGVGEAVALEQISLGVTALGATGASWVFNALGNAQGGAWGAADKGVGKSWGQVATDANNASGFFTDLGALTYDGVASGAAWLEGGPSPVTSSQFTKDLGNLGGSVEGLARLDTDFKKAGVKTVVDVGSQGIEAGLQVIHAPAGIRSGVDGFLTHTVASALAHW